MRRKCGLFVPFSVPFLVGFFLLSSLLLSSFGLATTVKASSAYDNLIETTSSLEVDADCSVADITASYGQYILDDSKWDTGFCLLPMNRRLSYEVVIIRVKHGQSRNQGMVMMLILLSGGPLSIAKVSYGGICPQAIPP